MRWSRTDTHPVEPSCPLRLRPADIPRPAARTRPGCAEAGCCTRHHRRHTGSGLDRIAAAGAAGTAGRTALLRHTRLGSDRTVHPGSGHSSAPSCTRPADSRPGGAGPDLGRHKRYEAGSGRTRRRHRRGMPLRRHLGVDRMKGWSRIRRTAVLGILRRRRKSGHTQ